MVLWLVHVVVTSIIGFYFAWRHGFALLSFGKKGQASADLEPDEKGPELGPKEA